MTCLIGTSGWSYRHWRGIFYPPELRPGKWLEFYQQKFDTVEINSSFYRLPTEATFVNWANRSKENFVFAVKASRFITHVKRLKEPEESVRLFLDRANQLGDKLGPILFQLPPGFSANPARLEAILQLKPEHQRWAFEFRDPSWFIPEVYRILERYGAAFCIYHLAGRDCPLAVTADWVYLRFHGDWYTTRYSLEELEVWAGRLQRWLNEGRDCFAYFNNDTAGYAIQNAQELIRLL